jgi:hypothetical protein
MQMPTGRFKLTRRDIEDIEMRIGARPALNKEVVYDAPEEIKQLINNTKCWKIEWMTHGIYQLRASEGYGKFVFNPNLIVKIASKYKIPYKLIDTCNMSIHSVVYRMWVESIGHPGKVIKYQGYTIGKGCKALKRSIRMCTVMIGGCYKMVTGTVVE